MPRSVGPVARARRDRSPGRTRGVTPMPTATPVHQTNRREPWPTEITVIAMQDPVVDQLPDATPTTSDDTLLWWAGTLGPTAVLLARHLAAYAAEGPTLWPLEDL